MTAEVYPFADVNGAGSYPAWIRGLRKRSGVYLIRERQDGSIAYVGESSKARLYGTLTRHFQQWTNKYDTAGATYDRADIDVAVIVVPDAHANYLQNELICRLDPVDNRLVYDQERDPDDGVPEGEGPPPGYDYELDLLLQGIAYQWPEGDLDDVPF